MEEGNGIVNTTFQEDRKLQTNHYIILSDSYSAHVSYINP